MAMRSHRASYPSSTSIHRFSIAQLAGLCSTSAMDKIDCNYRYCSYLLLQYILPLATALLKQAITTVLVLSLCVFYAPEAFLSPKWIQVMSYGSQKLLSLALALHQPCNVSAATNS